MTNNNIVDEKLMAIKSPQSDLFIADIFEVVSLQLDQKSLEFPLFALRSGDKRTRKYNSENISVVVAPSSEYGMATMHDKDVWIYCISKLMQGLREGKEICRTVNFTIYDYLKTTNKNVGGKDYERAKASLDRLRSTTITTNIETGGKRESRGFGLVDSWRIVEEKDGRMVRVSVTLPDWLYRSIEKNSVLTISPDYFRIRSGFDRRIYELARKHCGNQKSFVIGLDLIHEKVGTTSVLREFRRTIKALAESNHLPDYSVKYLADTDQLLFKNRKPEKIKDQRIPISYTEAVKIGLETLPQKLGEDDFQLVGRVIATQKYKVDTSDESRNEHKAIKAQKAQERERKAQENKWITIGNTVIDDDYIDHNIEKGETRLQARERLIVQLQQQLALDLENDDVPDHVRVMNERMKKEKKKNER